MKVAHLDSIHSDSARELADLAKKCEQEGNLKDAEKIYTKLTKHKWLYDKAYTRLMIIYRKQRLYKKELDIIDAAIDTTSKRAVLKVSNAKLKNLSLSIGRSVGLIDKKGSSLVDQEPVAGWKRRRTTVSKLLKKQK